MAKETDWQPTLSQTNFQADAGSMTRRLKGTGSSLGAVAKVAEIGLTAAGKYKEIKADENLANVREQVGAALDPLIQEGLLGSPTMQKEVADELSVWQETQNRIPLAEGPEDSEVLQQGITRVEGEVDRRIEFLKRAKDQGRMSAFTFEQNVKAISRKFISDNPALRKEILESVKNTLDDQGIVERLKYDEDYGKTQQESYENEVKNIRDNFEKFNIPELPFVNPNGTLDIRRSMQAIDVMRQQEAVYQAVSKDTNYNKMITDDEIRQFESSGVAPLLVGGAFSNDVSNLSMIFTENKGDFAKAKLTARTYLTQQMVNFKQDPRITRYMSSDVAKQASADYEKQVGALVTAMEGFNSLEDLQKYTSNAKLIMTDQQSMRLMQDFDVPRVELMMKIGQTANLINSPEGMAYMKELILNSRDLFSKGALTNSNLFKPVPGSTSSGMGVLLNQAATAAITKKDEGTVSTLDNVLKGFVEGINDPKISPTALDAYKRADEFILETSKPNFKDSFVDIAPETMNAYTSILGDYNDQLATSLRKYMTTNQGRELKISINPSTGRLNVQGADASFNNEFTTRIDRALKSYANLRGETTGAVYKDFYEEYYTDIFTGQTPAKVQERNNPLNLKDTSGNFRTFKDLSEAVPAYEEQIMRYAEGKTDGKKRTTVKDIVDLWRPASDRKGNTDIAQDKYYEVVSDFLGVSPRSQLDLSNKETMAKLITGMAQVEGTPNLDWQRVSSMLKKSKTAKQKNEENFRKSPIDKASEEYKSFESKMNDQFPSRD